MFACHKKDAKAVQNQLKAHLPSVRITQTREYVLDALPEIEYIGFADFTLSREFMLPLRMETKSQRVDPLLGFYGILEELGLGEQALLQVLWQQTHYPWAPNIRRSVSRGGKSRFSDFPHFPDLAQEKTAQPLFAAVVRLAAFADSVASSIQLANRLAYALIVGTKSSHNSLSILEHPPLFEDETDQLIHETDVLLGKAEPIEPPWMIHLSDMFKRQTRRSGMLLNSTELGALIRLPERSVQLSKLRQAPQTAKAVPAAAVGHPYVIGINEHQGTSTSVALSVAHRLRHIHIIGATGTGKSTLLERLFLQDVEQGNGCMLLDPHGDLVENIISRIPASRHSDVVVIDPSDITNPVGLNPLGAPTPIEQIVLTSDLVSLFRRLATSWGDQMNSVLANAVQAFVQSSKGGTLLDLRPLFS